MKKLSTWFGIAALVAVMLVGTAARTEDEDRPRHAFQARLMGPQEVPLTLSAARGELRLKINEDDSSVHFVLSYEGLQTPISASHIHVGQRNVNGGVTVFFCGGGGRPACPQGEGTVEGDFTAANVIGLPSQQLDPNDLAKLLRAIRAGKTYANLHTMTSPGGEIRGQILPRRGHDDDSEDDDN